MKYEEIAQNLQEYYANTLIVQYHGKKKASATIKLLVDLIYQKAILLQIRDAFDWKTAVGVQLDIIGKWVGIDRVYNFNPLAGNKLAYPQYSRIEADNYDASQGGYSDYATFADDNGGILTYADLQSLSNSLNDEEFRTIIGLKIIYNSIQNTVGNIDNAIWDYFGGKVYTTWDLNNMELTYNYPRDELDKIMQIAYNKGVLPAPTGIKILLGGS